METRRDNCPTVRLPVTERHIILMFIIGESLQNLPNIVNSDVIKVDWQSAWKSASLPWVYPLCRKQQQQCWNDKKFRIKLEGWRGSLFWQQIASECCWNFNKSGSPHGVHRALFLIWMSEEFLALRHDQNHHRVSNVIAVERTARDDRGPKNTASKYKNKHIVYTMTIALWLIRIILIHTAPVIIIWRSQLVPSSE